MRRALSFLVITLLTGRACWMYTLAPIETFKPDFAVQTLRTYTPAAHRPLNQRTWSFACESVIDSPNGRKD